MSRAVAPVFQNKITSVQAETVIQTRQYLQAKMDDLLHCEQYIQQNLTDINFNCTIIILI